MPDVQRYFQSFIEAASIGDTREESYYGDLSGLLGQYAEENRHNNVQVTILPFPTDDGNPDFKVRNETNEVAGYVEAKLLSGPSLDTIEETEQPTRYRGAFENVILMNFIGFHLYRNGEQVAKTETADPPKIPRFGDAPGAINTDDLDSLLERFFSSSQPEIETVRELATELAKRTSFMREIVL